MALDHYVSQVHLRNFNSPVLQNRFYAMRKSNLKTFTPRSEDVCRIEEGNTNQYLTEERAIEDFLRTVEPRYNSAFAKLRNGQPDQEAIHVVAGFCAYVASCAPAAMRLGTGPLEATVRSTALILDRQGVFGRAPASLGNKTMTELLADGAVAIDIDEKYPQAIGICTILRKVSLFGNCPWEILRNADAASPFFTSDFPVAIEMRGNTGMINRIVPLAPDLAVRIMPDIRQARAAEDFTFSGFRWQFRDPKRAAVTELNRLIVRSAEDLVFYAAENDWIERFVIRNRNYRIQTVMTEVPMGGGFGTVASQRILSYEQAETP